MRKIYLAFLCILAASFVQAQISVTATGGTASATYTTLKEAFDAINAGTHTNVIAVSVTANTTEVATAALNASGTGTSSYTAVTIKPAAGVTATIGGAVASAPLIKIAGNGVTIDGSNTAGGTTRNLTVTNTATTAPQVILIASTGTTPVSNVTIKNSVIINGVSSSSAVVVADAAGTAGYFNNITIQNNSVQKAYIGIYFLATIAANNGSGSVVTGNDLSTSGANAIRLVGVYMQGVDGGTVSNNVFGNFETTNAEIKRAVWFATGTVNSTITGNTITTLGYTGTGAGGTFAISVTSGNTGATTAANVLIGQNTISNLASSGTSNPTAIYVAGTLTNGVTVSRNIITNVKNSNSGGYGADGIVLASTSTTANTTVANNLISDIAGNGYASGNGVNDNGYGIAVSSGAGYNIYYNTVNLTTTQAVAGKPAAFNVTSAVTAAGAIDLRNNIFVTNQTNATYAIYSAAPNTVFSNIDYNDYYSTGTLGYIGSDRATLADIQTGFGGNTHSINVLPVFVAPANPRIQQTAANTSLNDKATPIAGITTDIDGEQRSATTPDLGGDEFSTTLPVKLIAFSGMLQGNDASLRWSTAFELNSKDYEIERSTSPTNFVSIGRVAASGNSTTTTSYSYVDKNIANGTTYYRLKMVDKDGRSEYSSIVKLTKLKKEFEVVIINPSKSKIDMQLNSASSGPVTVNLFNLTGQAIAAKTLQLGTGNTSISIGENLSKGTYVVTVTKGGDVSSHKVIVE